MNKLGLFLRSGEVICWKAAPSVDFRAVAARRMREKVCNRFCGLLDPALNLLNTIYHGLCLCAFVLSQCICECIRIQVKLVAELAGFSEDDRT